MLYEMYNYHESPVSPVQATDKKIFGLELEISDVYVDDVLDDLIERDIITVPANEDMTQNLICAEEDGSVYAELIFRADYKENIIRRVKEYLAPLRNCDNHSGTSAHIHLSRDYLSTRNISELDILQAVEFLYPLLFEISGRNTGSAEEWATSYIGHETAQEVDWTHRAAQVDTIRSGPSSRYWAVNCTNSETIEIRIFSNAYNFDPEYISAYLESADIIMDVAQHMKVHTYKEDPRRVANIYLNLMKERAPGIYRRHLKGAILSPQEVRRNKEINRFKKAARRINQLEGDFKHRGDVLRTARETIYLIMDHPEFIGVTVTTSATGMKQTIKELRAVNAEILRRFFLGY